MFKGKQKVGMSLLPRFCENSTSNMVHILKHGRWSSSKGILQIHLCQGTTVAPLASSILKVILTAFELVRMKLTLVETGVWEKNGASQL